MYTASLFMLFKSFNTGTIILKLAIMFVNLSVFGSVFALYIYLSYVVWHTHLQLSYLIGKGRFFFSVTTPIKLLTLSLNFEIKIPTTRASKTT